METLKRNVLGILDNELVYDSPTSTEKKELEFIGICENQNAYR